MRDLTLLARWGVAAIVKATEDAMVGRPSLPEYDPSGSPSVPPEEPIVKEPKRTPVDMIKDAIESLEEALEGTDREGEISDRDRTGLEEIQRSVKLMKAALEGEDILLSVKALITDQEGRVLVLRDAYSDYWDLPGGHVMEGETMESALRREVKEECGLDMVRCTQFDTRVLELGNEVKPVLFYSADVIGGQPRISQEHLGYEWADMREIENLNLGVYRDILLSEMGVARGQMGSGFRVKESGEGVGTPVVGADVHTDTGGGDKPPRRYKMDEEGMKEVDARPKYAPKGSVRAKSLKLTKSVYSSMQDNLMTHMGGYPDMRILYKASDTDHMVVAGYASPVIVDQEGHRISHKAFEDDLPRFMALDGKYANINILHSNVTVGKVIPEYVDSNGQTFKTGVDDVGLYVVAEVRTDPYAPKIAREVVKDVRNGKIRSFSISGNADNPVFMCDDEQCYYDIGKVELYEVTLCPEGVNPAAKFEIVG